MRVVLGLLFATVLSAGPALAGVACPENQIYAGCYPDATGENTSAPSATFGPSGVEPWSAGQACNSACYDLPAGVLAAKGSVNPYGGCIGGVQAHDVYQVVGPAGPPLAFEAVLQVHAVLAPFTSYAASIHNGAQTGVCNGGAADCEASIDLSFAPGVQFLIDAQIEAGGDTGVHPFGDVIATGTIRFRGLPAGYSVVSCQSYDLPTPVRASSWGGVKVLYR